MCKIIMCLDFSNLAHDAHFTTQSWIERVVIIGATKPSKVTLKAAGKGVKYSLILLRTFKSFSRIVPYISVNHSRWNAPFSVVLTRSFVCRWEGEQAGLWVWCLCVGVDHPQARRERRGRLDHHAQVTLEAGGKTEDDRKRSKNKIPETRRHNGHRGCEHIAHTCINLHRLLLEHGSIIAFMSPLCSVVTQQHLNIPE